MIKFHLVETHWEHKYTKIVAFKSDRCSNVIFIDLSCSPIFRGESEIAIGSNCDVKAVNSIRGFGNAYLNDTQFDEKTFFTEESFFIVKEIEVFL
jgi:hypothetical protein